MDQRGGLGLKEIAEAYDRGECCRQGHFYSEGKWYRDPAKRDLPGSTARVCIRCQEQGIENAARRKEEWRAKTAEKKRAQMMEQRRKRPAPAMVKTAEQFALTMAQLLSDVIAGEVEPQVANAAVNVGNSLLRAVELQYKYGFSPKASISGGRDAKEPEE